MGRRLTDISKFPEWVQKQIKEQLNGEDSGVGIKRNTNPKPKRGQRKTLGVEGQTEGCMVSIDCPVLVRITRVSPRRLDSDNFSGGAKEIRDAIASALGRKGDSERDGMKWEYVQEKGKHATRIEIFKEN